MESSGDQGANSDATMVGCFGRDRTLGSSLHATVIEVKSLGRFSEAKVE
jgi:hypothetical protein